MVSIMFHVDISQAQAGHMLLVLFKKKCVCSSVCLLVSPARYDVLQIKRVLSEVEGRQNLV